MGESAEAANLVAVLKGANSKKFGTTRYVKSNEKHQQHYICVIELA